MAVNEDFFVRLITLPYIEVPGRIIALENYPEINLNYDFFNASVNKSMSSSRPFDASREMLIQTPESVFKRITRTFFECGFADALNEARDRRTSAESPVLHTAAELIYVALNLLANIKERIYPSAREQDLANIQEFSETRDWASSNVRYIAWHPHCFKLAVAGIDDNIRIYTDEPTVVPVLKNFSQESITVMAWRPLSGGDLAVGCQTGICLWTLDTSSQVGRCSKLTVFLKHPKRCAITSMAWNFDGALLITTSIGDKNILIWSVEKLQQAPVKCVGPPCSFLKISPSGSHLLSATTGNMFRIWTTMNEWAAQRWTITSGCVRSACWSKTGVFLLFVTSTDPYLYRVQFNDKNLFTDKLPLKKVYPIVDLSKCIIGNREVGGLAHTIVWDESNKYLAIMFKDTPCVAVYFTTVDSSVLTVSPDSFISGIGAEYPTFICFQPPYPDNTDPLLTIAWSSGRVQYFPMRMLDSAQ